MYSRDTNRVRSSFRLEKPVVLVNPLDAKCSSAETEVFVYLRPAASQALPGKLVSGQLVAIQKPLIADICVRSEKGLLQETIVGRTL